MNQLPGALFSLAITTFVMFLSFSPYAHADIGVRAAYPCTCDDRVIMELAEENGLEVEHLNRTQHGARISIGGYVFQSVGCPTATNQCLPSCVWLETSSGSEFPAQCIINPTYKPKE